MKKKDAVYGLLDGRMVPLSKCSLTNLRNSVSSGWDSGISLPGSDAGTPGLSSMAWSHSRVGGNLCDASSLNTLLYCWYCAGILLRSSGVLVGSITIRPMKYQSL